MIVYADNAATTSLSPKVLEAMTPYLTEIYGNPSSLYRIGAEAKEAVENSRAKIAELIGAKDSAEIFFTSGGSEADNWAIKGVCRILKDKGEFYMVHRPERLVDILYLMRKYKVEPKELRFICSKQGQEPKMVLIKGVKNAKPFIKVKEDLYIYNDDGTYSEEVMKIYNDN